MATAARGGPTRRQPRSQVWARSTGRSDKEQPRATKPSQKRVGWIRRRPFGFVSSLAGGWDYLTDYARVFVNDVEVFTGTSRWYYDCVDNFTAYNSVDEAAFRQRLVGDPVVQQVLQRCGSGR